MAKSSLIDFKIGLSINPYVNNGQNKFWSHFCSNVSHGQHCVHGPKTTLKMLERVLAFPFNPYLKIEVSKMISLNPPPTKRNG